MCRLVSGIVLAVILVASIGCGGGLSEKEVREIVLEERARRQEEDADFLKDFEGQLEEVTELIVETTAAIQADYEAAQADYEATKRMLLEDRAQRQEEADDFLKDLERSILETGVDAFQQHVDSICESDYRVLTLSVALETLLVYLAGGESTLEEVAEVFIEGVPIDDRDFYGQYSKVCGITPEGHWSLQPIATQ